MPQPSVPPPSPYVPPGPIAAKVQPFNAHRVEAAPGESLTVVPDIAAPAVIESNALAMAPLPEIALEAAPRLDEFLTPAEDATALMSSPEAFEMSAPAPPTHLRVQARDGESFEFDITAPAPEPDLEPGLEPAQNQAQNQNQTQKRIPPSQKRRPPSPKPSPAPIPWMWWRLTPIIRNMIKCGKL